jgi:hypothetical protein
MCASLWEIKPQGVVKAKACLQAEGGSVHASCMAAHSRDILNCFALRCEMEGCT